MQVETIPAVLSGRDVVACAQTGTRKMAAFSLLIVNRLGPHRQGGVGYGKQRSAIVVDTV